MFPVRRVPTDQEYFCFDDASGMEGECRGGRVAANR